MDDGTFGCPFCTGEKKQDYQFEDLLHHATGIGASNSRKVFHNTRHRAFGRFLQLDLAPSIVLPSADLEAAVTAAAAAESEPPPEEELFVWPWMAVLVNADSSNEVNSLTDLGDANSLADQLADFHPADTVFLHLEDDKGGRSSSTTVIVKFQQSWDGFKNAIDFESHFKSNRRGWREWIELQGDVSSTLYGWIARSDDYNEDSYIGRYLRKHGELKTVMQAIKEEIKEIFNLVSNLTNETVVKHQHLHDLAVRYEKTFLVFLQLMYGKVKPHQAYNDVTTAAVPSAPRSSPPLSSPTAAASTSTTYSEPPPEDGEELFVSPWMAVLVNANPSDADGDTNSLADQLADFHPADTIFLHLEDEKGGRSTSTTVIVKFQHSWGGFENAMCFEKHFKASRHGRKEWIELQGDVSSTLHGWIAHSDDYNEDSGIGWYLRKHSELKTIKQVSEEENKEKGKLVSDLSYQINVKNQQLHDWEVRNNKINLIIHQLMYEKDKLHRAYNDEMGNLQRTARDTTRKIFEENEKLKAELELTRKEVESQSKKLEAQNEDRRKKLDDEKQKVEVAAMLQKETEEEVLRLIEKQKGLEDLLTGHTLIGIKRMGELDVKAFQNVARKKFKSEEADIKAAELCSSWQEEMKNPSWHPFKIVVTNGKEEEFLVEDDPKLKKLWIEYGDDVCNAVKTALQELNEYCPTGKYVVPELWNFKVGRKATMKEIVRCIMKHWKSSMRTR
ncbi:factor of DNA methylation 1-like isoform X2 [Zingiber officinale]|uniref:factor of DNA methylation 1-like isoform X2 n=1 Tax=Zingiber officinale TaxID=94328 RepID=UPI001C4D56FA|nr:factor of DNA methylation 1-like isoform X2 [Zingiber officinale]